MERDLSALYNSLASAAGASGTSSATAISLLCPSASTVTGATLFVGPTSGLCALANPDNAVQQLSFTCASGAGAQAGGRTRAWGGVGEGKRGGLSAA